MTIRSGSTFNISMKEHSKSEIKCIKLLEKVSLNLFWHYCYYAGITGSDVSAILNDVCLCQ